ncbi:MAG: hypothetical protein CME68_05475 [Halobacteriovoraceae bacterium]|nr:hypothetical protein [Halobacteriovoraceae bacterium]|tara:strand:+ start:600 stop:1613 length:1014 start_codon:yes stop_codon:yes gene_type:complete
MKLFKFHILPLIFLFLFSCGEMKPNNSEIIWKGVKQDNGWIYIALQGGLSISKDGGSTFENKTTAHGLGNNYIRSIYVDNDNVIYAGTTGGLSISTDGGASFTNKTSSDGLAGTAVNRIIADSNGKIYLATSGGLSITSNGGESFTNKGVSDGLGSNSVRDVSVNSSGHIFLATTGGVSISTNGGTSFSNKTTAQGLSDNLVLSVFGDDNGDIYAGVNDVDGGLHISTDNGSSFSRKTTSDGLKGNYVDGQIFKDSKNLLYIGTFSGVSTTSNGGSSFNSFEALLGYGGQAIFLDSNEVIYAGNLYLWISTDSGSTFVKKTTSDGLASGGINDIFVR